MDAPLSFSDQELVSKYLSGHQSSLEALIKRHRRKVFSAIYLLVRNRQVAEDIFQDTFIKVINTLRAGAYSEEGKFLPWVLRIAHNLVIDHFRRESRMPKVRDNEEYSIFDTFDGKLDNAQDAILKKQMHARLRALVHQLPHEQKEVVIMRHFADMSFREIADTTQVSINTALGRMRYALINLRRHIEENKITIEEQ